MATHPSPLPKGQDHTQHHTQVNRPDIQVLRNITVQDGQLREETGTEPQAKGSFSTAHGEGSRHQIGQLLSCGAEAAVHSEGKQGGPGGGAPLSHGKLPLVFRSGVSLGRSTETSGT